MGSGDPMRHTVDGQPSTTWGEFMRPNKLCFRTLLVVKKKHGNPYHPWVCIFTYIWLIFMVNVGNIYTIVPWMRHGEICFFFNDIFGVQKAFRCRIWRSLWRWGLLMEEIPFPTT